jgi:ribosome biogenesis protein ERB1
MTKRSKGANEDKLIETKSKNVSGKSQKQKKPVEAESLKEEDLLQASGTDSDYDGDSLPGSLNSDDFDSDFSDSEDDGTHEGTEDGDVEFSDDDDVLEHDGSIDNEDDDGSEHVGSDNNEEHGSDEDSERGEAVEESDSSEDEVPSRNTVGNVPLKWYEDEKHIGYDLTGKKITKKEKQDKLDSFLATIDDSKTWRKIYDEYNDEDVELTKEESKIVQRILKGEAPHADFDPYAPYVEWFKHDDAIHPLSSAPEPKRRFIPSKWEAKKVVKIVRAIRKGWIKFDKPEEEPNVYLLWGDDSTSDQKSKHLTYIPPPKLKLPGENFSLTFCCFSSSLGNSVFKLLICTIWLSRTR